MQIEGWEFRILGRIAPWIQKFTVHLRITYISSCIGELVAYTVPELTGEMSVAPSRSLRMLLLLLLQEHDGVCA